MLNGLDLFSGIGGITNALHPWVAPVAYCENDKYAQGVLLSRQRKGELPPAPIWDDICTLTAKMLPEIDIVYGGFPCQDISTAGRGVGLSGERSSLVFEILRIAKEVKSPFIFLENVPAIRTRGAERIGKELADRGYDCRWTTISAEEVGAHHKRNRWFLFAYSNRYIRRYERKNKSRGKVDQWSPIIGHDGEKESVAYPSKPRLQGTDGERGVKKKKLTQPTRPNFWESEPTICRVVDGLPLRRHRIKCLGNAVVPQQVREAFCYLTGLENV